MKSKEELSAIRGEVEILNKKLRELSREELAQVAGGDIFDDLFQWIASDFGYESGVTPKFSIGQAVTFYYLGSWRNGEIVSIDSRNAGIINTEYLYTVLQTGAATPTHGIYESNIKAR